MLPLALQRPLPREGPGPVRGARRSRRVSAGTGENPPAASRVRWHPCFGLRPPVTLVLVQGPGSLRPSRGSRSGRSSRAQRGAVTPLSAPLERLCPPGAEPLGRTNARSAWGAGPGGSAGLRNGPAGSPEPLRPGRARRAAARPPVPASRTVFCDCAGGQCRAGKQALTERESVGQMGKGKCRAPGSGRGVLSPGTGFHPRQSCPGQRAARAAREANTASPLLPRD